jgi:hypothetical protein
VLVFQQVCGRSFIYSPGNEETTWSNGVLEY